jgi:DNA invertase Pin-like site-specific DNA recombinase
MRNLPAGGGASRPVTAFSPSCASARLDRALRCQWVGGQRQDAYSIRRPATIGVAIRSRGPILSSAAGRALPLRFGLRAPATDDPGADGSAVLGYATTAQSALHGDADDLREQAETVVAECQRLGLTLLELVRERESGSAESVERPGLGYALDRISAGEATGLVVADLAHLGRSVSDLADVLEWFSRSDARLVAAAQGLDTAESGGRLAAETLIEMSAWEPGQLGQRAPTRLEAAGTKLIRDSLRGNAIGTHASDPRPQPGRFVNGRASLLGEALQALAATLAAAHSRHEAVSLVMVGPAIPGDPGAGALLGDDVTDALLAAVDAQSTGRDDIVWHEDDRASWVALPGVLPRRAQAIADETLRAHVGAADLPIGIAGFPRDAATAEALIDRCRMAFEVAERLGGARAVLTAEVPAEEEGSDAGRHPPAQDDAGGDPPSVA